MWLNQITPNLKFIIKLNFLCLILMMALLACGQASNNEADEAKTTEQQPASCNAENCWAFEETFNFDPSSPSQALLPRTFDYVITHRSHPSEHFTKTFGPYPADHGDDCAGPNPDLGLAPQHEVISSHLSNGNNPDSSFFICKNHMMSSLGDVSGYSVSAFWPKQDFDFSNGGVLEFDVNINDRHRRSWFEIMITPREELKVGAARVDLPIDETYPKDHIVLVWGFIEADSSRFIQVGKDQLAPEGLYVEAKDYRTWRNDIAPNDPALTDRRIRRTMRISLENKQIIWEVEKEDGSFDPFIVDVPEGLPFDKGLVVFKTHAYTPVKDGNTNTYTFHWDNIRFSGPVTGKYKTFEADPEAIVYLQQNGDRDIGESQEISIELPEVGNNPVLFGQVNSPQKGQVLLSINGAPPQAVSPYDYEDNPDCHTDGWQSFRLELDPSQLKLGSNTFNWIIGERPACANNRFYPWDPTTPINTGSGFYPWNGFSIKNLEIQVDE